MKNFKVVNNNKNNNNGKKFIWDLPEELKKRYYNHRSSFAHEIFRHKASLSKYVWEIKEKQGIDPILELEII